MPRLTLADLEDLRRQAQAAQARQGLAVPRRFQLVRHKDLSGVSGVGIVAEGVLFSDGRVALRWVARIRSTVAFDSLADVLEAHGHGDASKVVWLDEETA